MPQNTQEATQQATNETSGQATQEQTAQEQTAQEQPSAQAPEQQVQEQQPIAAQPKRTHNDRITELESKLARMEALYQLNGLNVVDTEVCADLLMKGYTIDQLRKSKPYLFGQAQSPAMEPAQGQTQGQIPTTLGVVKQPPRVVAETQSPKAVSVGVSPDGFVKQLAEMLKSKF